MKIALLLLALVGLSCATVSAKTLHFPNKGSTMFDITIPDDWEPEKDEDEIIEASSPDDHVYMSIWELETKEDVESVGKDIEDMLKDHAKKIKFEGQPQKATPGGLDGLLFKGSAEDKEDNHAIEFFALLVSNKTKLAVIYIEADSDTPEAESKSLQTILQSIKGK